MGVLLTMKRNTRPRRFDARGAGSFVSGLKVLWVALLTYGRVELLTPAIFPSLVSVQFGIES